MNNSTTSSSNDHRSIEYTITCSDSTGQEEKFIFQQHTAPSSLCRQFDPSSSSQIKMQISQLMVDLIKTHHNEVLQARDWSCVECNQRATTIIHNPMSYLHLSNPQIIDMAIPSCANKTCDNNIKASFAEMMSSMGIPNGLA